MAWDSELKMFRVARKATTHKTESRVLHALTPWDKVV
jgi:hypothetical protein